MAEEITKGVFEVTHAANLEEIFEQQAENIEALQKELEERIKNLEAAVEEDEFAEISGKVLEDAIFRRAFLDCVDIIKDKAMNFLVTEAVRATVVTQEFNYDLYVDHLLTAMEANKEKLIGIIPYVGKKAIEVKVNLNILGKPEQWGKAIEKYRKQKGLGKARGAMGEHGEMSSYFWKEKYYGTGREGTQVKKVYKEGKGGGKKSPKDVTSKYKDKYRDTIRGRLANLPSNKAPFWYLIEHGNINIKLGMEDEEGVPYPVFGPTNFARNSQEAIASAFLDIWTQYEEKAREIFEELEDERVRELRERTEERIEAGEKLAENRLVERIKIDEGDLESYNRTWGVQVSLRDPKTGYYAKLPTGR